MNRLIPYSDEVYAYLMTGYVDGHWIVELATCLGIVALLWLRDSDMAAPYRIAAVLLAILWAWIGVGFYWQTYQPLNWAGYYFGWAALLQALLIAGWGSLSAGFRPAVQIGKWNGWVGVAALLFAALIGPIMDYLAGEEVVARQAIGVTPLATISATFALWLLNRMRTPFWLSAIPVLLLGWEALRSIVLVLHQDIPMVIVAGLVAVLLLRRLVRA